MSTIFMGVHEQEIRNSKTSGSYDKNEVSTKIGHGGFTVVERISKGTIIARCICGREFSTKQSSLKFKASCGKCKNKAYIYFHAKRREENSSNSARYSKIDAEKLLMFWSEIEKFSKNINDTTLTFPVIHGIPKHSVMILADGILVKEYFVDSIIREKQRILDFLR